jgi:AmmeMemoRadiSam system protein A
MYSQQEKNLMLSLARSTLEEKLSMKSISYPRIPQNLRQKRACFVTLTINGKLRGCIGHILPVQELWKDIRENALAAAFRDPRFPPLTRNEFNLIRIEISVLTIPKQLFYHSTDTLIECLLSARPGVILKKDQSEATFLPQVWNEIPDVNTFLSELCIKAGLFPDAWKKPGINVYTYNAEIIHTI